MRIWRLDLQQPLQEEEQTRVGTAEESEMTALGFRPARHGHASPAPRISVPPRLDPLDFGTSVTRNANQSTYTGH